jgi:hypothetical protein
VKLSPSTLDCRYLLKVLLVVGAVLCSALAFGQTPLNNDAVMKMVTAGLGEDVIVSMINTQPGNYPLTPDNLIALKKAGVSDKIIAAMVAKGSQPNSTAGSSPATPAGAAVSTDVGANLEIGVYFKKKDELVDINPEVVNWKTGGFLKNVASGGLIKGDVNGNIKGGQSKNRLTFPLEFLIKTPEGVAITEYQLIRLHQNKDEREFRTVTGGVLHTSGGATRDVVDFEGKRIANRTFSVVLPENIGSGEYGFLPPGAVGSANSASIGKMYTFRIVE